VPHSKHLFYDQAMKPAPGKHVEWVDQEAVVLDTESREIHYLNPPAAVAYALILEHGYDEAMAQLKQSFGTESDFEKEVAALVDEMVERGLLVVG
jgi:hypothetical protein